MTPAEFKLKWHRYTGKESSAYQSHFNDLCELLQQPTRALADPRLADPTLHSLFQELLGNG